jgi:putative nucleotidyltransferase with HDIG domain
MNRELILQKLDTIDDLPTLPTVMVKLSRTLDDANCCSKDIVKILSSDPAICARILKTVNSPLFNRGGGEDRSLQNAITRLGFREVKNIVLSTSVFNMFAGVPDRLFDRTCFWRHCLATSLISIEIARQHPPLHSLRADELHLAGLIHDLGKMILDAYFPELFETALRVSVQERLPLFEAEQAALGIDHGEIGCEVAKTWHLPPFAVETIRHHHDPEASAQESRNLVRVVHLANYLANTQELGAGGDMAAPVFRRDVRELLGIDGRLIQRIVTAAVEEENALNHLL